METLSLYIIKDTGGEAMFNLPECQYNALHPTTPIALDESDYTPQSLDDAYNNLPDEIRDKAQCEASRLHILIGVVRR